MIIFFVFIFCFQRSDRDVTSVTSHAIEPLRSSEYFSFVFFRRVTPVAIKMSLYGALHLGRKPSLSFLCNGLHPLLPIFGSSGATLLGSEYFSFVFFQRVTPLAIKISLLQGSARNSKTIPVSLQ